MKTKREFPQVIVSKKGERWSDSGHPWIYESDVIEINGVYHDGDLVDVISISSKYLGTGFLSLNSKIRVRLISRDASSQYDEDFFRRRIEYAVDYRLTTIENMNAVRLIFGESDQFPGLTVDKFNDILVTQIVTVGIEQRKDMIYRLLKEVLQAKGYPVKGIYERNDVAVRQLEGLKEYTGWYGEALDISDTTIIENGLYMNVDFVNGQKTGYFLDQRDNRALVAALAKGKKVLDCFTHTGSFALNCAAAGAEKVVAVDISPTALKQAGKNAQLNGLSDKITFVEADVFEYLESVRKKEYDLIILDPPAFTKSRKTVDNAYKGYLEINMKAMTLLSRGGYLATCSCSHFMPHELFEKMLKEACYKTNYQLKQISATQQAKDHPILLNVPETDYLKFYLFQVI